MTDDRRRIAAETASLVTRLVPSAVHLPLRRTGV